MTEEECEKVLKHVEKIGTLVAVVEQLACFGTKSPPKEINELRVSVQELKNIFLGLPECAKNLETIATTKETGNDKHRVLVAEDNLFTQRLMTRLLERNGYLVEIAENGYQVLDKLQEDKFDIVLMDLKMPDLDGWKAAEMWRLQEDKSRRKRIPILAVTALSGPLEQERALQAGMDGFHSKPVNADALFGEIEQLLGLGTLPSLAWKGQSESQGGGTPAVDLKFDRYAVLRSLDGDWQLFREVVDLFLQDVPKQLDLLQVALGRGDAYQIYDIAHTMKGASGAFGKTRVYETALSLEMLGRKGELENAPMVLNQLRQELELLTRALLNALNEGNV